MVPTLQISALSVWSRFLVILVFVFFLFGCGSGTTEEESSEMPGMRSMDRSALVEDGGLAYRRYCTSCHGENGNGDGQASDILSVPATDLTKLEANNDGVFPTELIVTKIDGREEVRGHNRTREMPVWANIWIDEFAGENEETAIRERINLITEYIRTLQITE